jgi:hypothetical protein
MQNPIRGSAETPVSGNNPRKIPVYKTQPKSLPCKQKELHTASSKQFAPKNRFLYAGYNSIIADLEKNPKPAYRL